MSGPSKRPRLDESWMDEAACLDSWDLFFGPDSAEVQGWQEAQARRICAGCPVQVKCDQYATAIGERNGIWAGVNRERKRYGKRSELQS